MLDGVHVLNKVVETKSPSWAILVAILLFIIIVIIAFVVEEKTNDGDLIAIIMFGGLAISVLFYLFVSIKYETPTGKYTYQVTIDKNVDFSEFNSKYEIIETEGEIYTIKEK